jgi:phytoene dehydrogenase-like protein
MTNGLSTCVDRRSAVAIGAIGALAAPFAFGGLTRRAEARLERTLAAIPTRLAMPSVGFAHPRLRDGAAAASPAPVSERTGVAIVGGGMAGLAAAWTLTRRGFHDFVLLELEGETGGNARGGRNERGAYPLGAHYLPLPGEELALVRSFLEDAGILTGYDAAGLPVYDEFALCGAPHERLHLGGVWQEGLVPRLGLQAGERAQITEFFRVMAQMRDAVGRDGLRAFAIPVDQSSQDEAFVALDSLTMTEWLARGGFDSPHLHWYVDYCCRDDFGTLARETSAWAAIQYFAARRGQAANAEDGTVLTWRDGNAHLARRLLAGAEARTRTGALVTSIAPSAAGGYVVSGARAPDGASFALEAAQVICAAPQFVAARLLEGRSAAGFSYAPWLVANLTLESLPDDKAFGAPLAWDNVGFGAPSLGYVVADHQSLEAVPRGLSITHYWPLAGEDPKAARQAALAAAPADWRRAVVGDLARLHPGVEEQVRSLELWIWGHAMVRPTPGFIWGSERRAAQKPHRGVIFAHSDLAGVSIFEEALYRGHAAALLALTTLRAGA